MRESPPNSFPFGSASTTSLATVEPATTALQIKLADDPWSLSHAERLDLRATLAAAQASWLRQIEGLVEPPGVDDAFPAFLLATAPFEPIARAVGDTRERSELDTGTADALQRFVDHYRYFLTTE